jgi:hypothetical protein
MIPSQKATNGLFETLSIAALALMVVLLYIRSVFLIADQVTRDNAFDHAEAGAASDGSG